MQEGCVDYYEEGGGCCLHCSNAYKGCLCYECKCTKCYWYSSPESVASDKGWCDKVSELKEENKRKIKEYYEKQEELNYNKFKELQEINKNTQEKIILNNNHPNFYTCQKCKREFCSEVEYNIINNKEPRCPICSGDKNGL